MNPSPLPVDLEAVLTTDELARRPARVPGHAAEARALSELARCLAEEPGSLLRRLSELVVELCRAGSAGVSILEPGGEGGVFRWHVIAGALAPHLGGTIPREASPCGVVLDRDATLLFARPDRHFRDLVPVDPPMAEALLVPFHLGGKPVGTVWAVAHAPDRQFDAEDARLLQSLSRFAAAGHQMAALRAEREGREAVEERVRERTAEVAAARAFAESIVDTVRDPLLVLDADLRVVGASRAFYQTFGVSPGETAGRLVYDLGNRQWDIPRLRTLLEEILPRSTTFRDFEVEHRFEHIGRKVMLLNARWLRRGPGERELILLAIEDATARRDAEEARREAETRFTEMVKNVRDHSIFLTDPDGVVTSWNVAAERVIGYPEAEAVGQHFSLIFTPEDVKAGVPEEELRQAREWGRAEDERWHRRKGGERFWALGIVTPLRDAGGKLTGYSKILRDMTDRKRLEEVLRLTEERFRHAVSVSTVGVVFFELGGRVTDANAAFERMSGYTVGELRAQADWTALTAPEFREATARAAAELADRGETAPYEKEMVRKDGSRWWGLFAPTRLSGSGPVAECVKFVIDITRAKAAEAALRESEERLRLMADALPALIAYIGADGRYQFNSAAYECWFGRPRDWYAGRHMREVLGDAAYAVLEPHVAAALSGQPRTFEARVPYQEAGTRDVLVHYVPHRDPDGRVVGFFNLVIDLTERKQAQEALRASEERLRLAVRAANVGLWDWDMRAHTVTYTPEWKAQLGYADDEIGNDQGEWVSRLHPDDRGPALDSVWRAIAGPDPVDEKEFRMRHKDGSWRWIYSRAEVIRDAAGTPVRMLGSHVDITDRKQSEAAVRRSEERLRAILDTAADAIITIDGGGTIQSVNPAAERMFGYAAAEMTGRDVAMLMPSPHREEHDHYLAEYLRTRVSRVIGVGREVEAVRKDGTLFPVELAVSEVDHLPLFTGILHDLTRRKELEREVVEVVSLEQRRIGQDLHDSVAQELTALNLLVDDLGDTLRNDPAGAAGLIERMAGGLRRSQEQLRAVLRGLLPVAVDVAGLMAALADLGDRTGREGGPACSFDCPEPISVADNVVATQLYLIAQEAVRNAVRHARPRAVRITLESNGHLILRVRDDGIGMPARPTEIQGLGLRIMRDRAAIIGATLTIGPAEPTGTVVTCTLARTWDEQQPAREEDPGADRR